ncbi:hypothetical protein CEN49_19180 [Fischerella thermalis CCMEE 5273]|nr:hypothetical protein CEN49_19180 [Fischerella thermalis CCMEE 5273]
MKTWIKQHPIRSFFILTFTITWGLELLRLYLGFSGLSMALTLEIAGAGPSLAGLVVAWIVGGRREVHDLFRRAFKWRVGIWWYIWVIVIFPVLLISIIATAMVLSGQPFQSALPGPWWLIPAFLPLVLFFGPLQEELGWRAFALPVLMERYGWLSAGLVIGLVWALWHRTPTTWSAITWSDPLSSTGLFGLILGAVIPDVALSVLMAWTFWRTRGSAFLAGLGMHTAANYALFLPALPTGAGATAATWAVTGAFAGFLVFLSLLVILVERRRMGNREENVSKRLDH